MRRSYRSFQRSVKGVSGGAFEHKTTRSAVSGRETMKAPSKVDWGKLADALCQGTFEMQVKRETGAVQNV